MNNYFYEIKLPYYDNNNLEDLDYAEKFTKNILKKILKNNDIKGIIDIDVYINKKYGIIINIRFGNFEDYIIGTHARIIFHIDNYFLYEMDYFDIDEDIRNLNNIYYYKDKFYLNIKDDINLDKYYKILEFSNVIYDNYGLEVINKGIRLNNKD